MERKQALLVVVLLVSVTLVKTIDNTRRIKVYIWGEDFVAQLGNSTFVYGDKPNITIVKDPLSAYPVRLPYGEVCDPASIVDNGAGTYAMGCISTNGTTWMWGGDSSQQVGVLSPSPHFIASPVEVPIPLNKTCAQLSFGNEHSGCLTTTGDVVMWGSNQQGQLGIGKPKRDVLPTVVPNVKCTQLRLGGEHTACLTPDHRVLVWGSNTVGQCGLNSNTSYYFTPQQVALPSGNRTCRQLSAGYAVTGCLTSTGETFVWGFNGFRTGPQQFLKPVRVLNDTRCANFKVLGFNNGACVVDKHTLVLYGDNRWGALGNGKRTPDSRHWQLRNQGPTVLKLPDNDTCDIFRLNSFSAGCISVSGNMYTWGQGITYRLGTGTNHTVLSPTKVSLPQGTPVNFFFGLAVTALFMEN